MSWKLCLLLLLFIYIFIIYRYKLTDINSYTYISSILVLNYNESETSSLPNAATNGVGKIAMQCIMCLMTTMSLVGGFSVGPELLLVRLGVVWYW